jgi:GAF domain-containing protein
MKEQGIAIPVVLMTFYGSEEIAIEVFRLGVRDYVIKPFTDEELLTAIEGALKEGRLRRQREILYRVGKLVASLPDTDVFLKGIVEAATKLAGTSEVSLFLVGEDGRSLINRATLIDGTIRINNQIAQNPLAWQAIRGLQPVIGQPHPDRKQQQSIVPVCVPMIAGEISFGVLVLTLPADNMSSEQLALLDTLSDYAAIGLERARLSAML